MTTGESVFRFALTACVLLGLFGNPTIAISKDHFYQLQGHHFTLPHGDDEKSSGIHLHPPFHIYRSVYRELYVSTDGLISFNKKDTELEPTSLPTSGSFIAVLWGDADTTSEGVVSYGITRDHLALMLAREQIRAVFPTLQSFKPSYLFIATWDGIGYFDDHKDLVNTFQCVLATDGSTSFVIFQYANDGIQWTAGDSHGSNGQSISSGEYTAAISGFNFNTTVDQVRYRALPFSGTDDIQSLSISSNCGNPGSWIFRVDLADIQSPIESIQLCPLASNCQQFRRQAGISDETDEDQSGDDLSGFFDSTTSEQEFPSTSDLAQSTTIEEANTTEKMASTTITSNYDARTTDEDIFTTNTTDLSISPAVGQALNSTTVAIAIVLLLSSAVIVASLKFVRKIKKSKRLRSKKITYRPQGFVLQTNFTIPHLTSFKQTKKKGTITPQEELSETSHSNPLRTIRKGATWPLQHEAIPVRLAIAAISASNSNEPCMSATWPLRHGSVAMKHKRSTCAVEQDCPELAERSATWPLQSGSVRVEQKRSATIAKLVSLEGPEASHKSVQHTVVPTKLKGIVPTVEKDSHSGFRHVNALTKLEQVGPEASRSATWPLRHGSGFYYMPIRSSATWLLQQCPRTHKPDGSGQSNATEVRKTAFKA